MRAVKTERSTYLRRKGKRKRKGEGEGREGEGGREGMWVPQTEGMRLIREAQA